jgi:hypothetical protein
MTMKTKLSWILLTLSLVALGAATAGAETWTVKLRDGSTHEGQLIRLEAGRYLLQSEGTIYELSDDDIDPATFARHSRKDAQPDRPVAQTHLYDELHADGTATMHWESRVHNDSKKALTEMRFGLAPWERAHADARQYHDPFGNALVPSYDPPRERWAAKPDARIQVDLPLTVPVAPGETTIVNCQETAPRVQRTEKGFRYLNHGDYAENRLVWLKVRLPYGASIDSITPTPTARFTEEGYEYVMWRRYYAKGEMTPLEIRYTLPEEGR